MSGNKNTSGGKITENNQELTPEQQIESLKSQVESLQNSLTIKEEQLTDSVKQNELLTGKIQELNGVIEQHNADSGKSDLAEELETAKGVIADLQRNYDDLKRSTAGMSLAPVITIGEKKYLCTLKGKTTFKGKPVTAQIIAEDSELAEMLVEKGVGYLEEFIEE